MKAPSTLFLRAHIPCANLLLTGSKGSPHAKRHPILCFCKSIQTNSYEIANGSYLLTVQQTKEKNIMVLGKVDALRKRVVSVGKEHASLCAKLKQRLHELLNLQMAKIKDTRNNQEK